MKYNQLGRTDMTVSAFSLGGSAFGGVFGKTDDDECVDVVRKAVASGVNMLDTAPFYGNKKSEEVFGKILPHLPRSSYYINTKVGRYGDEGQRMLFDFSAERTLRSVDESLKRVGVEYFDIIQAHDIEFSPSLELIVNGTLPALQKVKEQGKARYIGVTAYPISVLKKVVDMSKVQIDTIISYCHGSMNDNTLQNDVKYFKDRGIGVINASGVSMGLLTDQGPAEWHPANQEIKNACKQAALYCKERQINISRLAVHFCLSQPDVASTLLSTASMKEFEANLTVAESGITEEEKVVMAEVIERYFDPLETRHWEGVELESYWAAMKEAH